MTNEFTNPQDNKGIDPKQVSELGSGNRVRLAVPPVSSSPVDNHKHTVITITGDS